MIYKSDYLRLFLSTCFALLGLIKDNSTLVLVSMLFSSLGGPFKKIKFLWRAGLKYIMFVLLIGFVHGLLFGHNQIELTDEQESRSLRSTRKTSQSISGFDIYKLFITMLIAMIVGIAMALIEVVPALKNDANMIIGISMGISLVPPLVNSAYLLGRQMRLRIDDTLVDEIKNDEFINNIDIYSGFVIFLINAITISIFQSEYIKTVLYYTITHFRGNTKYRIINPK